MATILTPRPGDPSNNDIVVQTLPLRRARIEVWDFEGAGTRKISTTPAYTDLSGYYSIAVTNSDPDGSGIDPFLLDYATDDGRARVTESSGVLIYSIRTISIGTNLADGGYTFLYTASSPAIPNIQPFFIFDLIANTAYDYLQANTSWNSFDTVTVRWPATCAGVPGLGSCYTGNIAINLNDGWEKDLHHEMR